MKINDYFSNKRTASISIVERRRNFNSFSFYFTIVIQILTLFLSIGIVGTLNQFHKKILELENNQNKIFSSLKCSPVSTSSKK